MTAAREIVTDQREQFAFHDDIAYLAETKRGLTRATVEEISAFKNEPDWMLQYRLRAYEHFLKRPIPTWTDGLDKINFDNIVYYRKPSEREEKSWDDVPDQIKATFERLGIPEAERKFLAGVGAQYDSEVVYHSVKEELTKLGVVFMGTDQALIEYPEIFRKHFGTVVPAEDNKFSALNAAVWSGGSFVYVPKGVEVPLPLQAYFRINGENTGQFERTLIVVDEGAKVHYIEGCTAPIYATESLHVAVVEVVALPGSKVRYTTIQNWSNDVYNLVTKRAHAYENSTVEWIDANTGSRKTVKFPAIYLRGEGATADIISVAVAGKGQHQDTGAKAVHLAPNTRSRIVSKSVSKDGGRATYRGHLKVSPGATNAVASVRCDALDDGRHQPQRHLPVHRHPGRRHVDDPRGDGRQGQRRAGLLPDEPRPDRERGDQPHRPGLPRGLHQGTADGIRHRVQPPRQARDGGVARMTVASPRPRPARQGLTDFTLPVQRDDIDEIANLPGDTEWLAADRQAAFDAFEALPAESNQLYTTYFDLRTVQLANARLTPAPRTAPIAADLPAEGDGILIVEEGDLTGLALSAEATAAGVTLTTIADLAARDPGRVRELLDDGSILPADDRFAQLTRALWSQGVVLDVPAGVRLARPIIIRWHAGDADRALISRTLISLGEGATATVLEELVASGAPELDGGQSFLAGTLEVRLARDARLELASLQELPATTVAFQHRNAVVGEGATLHWALAQLGSRLVRSRVDNRLEGDRSSVEQVEIVFGGSDQVFDLTSYTHHVGRDTTGNLLSKGALLDKARSFMKGMIVIDRSAVGTDSFLGEFGMNLSKATRSVAIPSLEIDQPDCRRAAHASSVGPIDESQLFYLESRGIPPDEARKFIVLGFLEPVVARVPVADAQDRLRELLERKWDDGIDTGAIAAA